MSEKNDRPFLQDSLWNEVNDRIKDFNSQALYHKRLNRSLWFSSSLISVLVALTATFDFTILSIKSQQISAVLAIILPLVTGYIVLRTPEKLWIHEVSFRNRLSDIRTKLEFELERDPKYDKRDLEEQFLTIMAESNDKWLEIKQG